MSRAATTVTNTARTADRLAGILPAALSALHDARPGFPASTPGSGSVGGGASGLPSSSVERLAGHLGRDRALVDAARLQRCIAVAAKAMQEAHQIATAYTSSTTSEVGTVAGAELCSSCIRVHQPSAVFAAGLCRWCYDYGRAEGGQPPADLLAAHHEGRRVTSTMMARSRATRKR